MAQAVSGASRSPDSNELRPPKAEDMSEPANSIASASKSDSGSSHRDQEGNTLQALAAEVAPASLAAI